MHVRGKKFQFASVKVTTVKEVGEQYGTCEKYKELHVMWTGEC